MTASAFATKAMEIGADILTNTKVLGIKKSGSSYEITTNNGTLRAKKVVVTTGPWSKTLFASLGIAIPIKPSRHPVAIYQRPEEFSGIRTIVFDFPRESYYKPEGRRFFYTGSLAAELDRSRSTLIITIKA